MKKRILIGLVLLALAVLVYFQVKTWKKFDWHTFKTQTEDVNVGLIAAGVGWRGHATPEGEGLPSLHWPAS